MNRAQLYALYRAAGNSPCQAYRLASGALQADRGDGLVLWACTVALAVLALWACTVALAVLALLIWLGVV